jgi:hypothetical protein
MLEIRDLVESSQLSVYRLPRGTRYLVAEALNETPKAVKAYLALVDYRDRCGHDYFIMNNAIPEIVRCECKGKGSYMRGKGEVEVVIEIKKKKRRGGLVKRMDQTMDKDHYPEFFYHMLVHFAKEVPESPRYPEFPSHMQLAYEVPKSPRPCLGVEHFTERLRNLGYHELWGIGKELDILDGAASGSKFSQPELFHACVRAFVAFPFLPTDALDGLLRSIWKKEKFLCAYLRVPRNHGDMTSPHLPQGGLSARFVAFPIKDMGSLQGFLFIELEGGQRPGQVAKQIGRVIEQFPPMIRAAREADFLHIPLKPEDDPVEHLVRHLPVVQSWGRIEVLRNGQCSYYAEDCECEHESRLREWKLKKASPARSSGNYSNALKLSDILDPRILPGCTDEDRQRFGDLELRFFPHDDDEGVYNNATHWPERKRQIIRLLSVLLERHRTYRHGLQAAVSAVMSRNVAHNLHSHITPRVTLEKIRERLENLEYGGNLLEVIQDLRDRWDDYLQRRSDFLAEVTSEPLMTTEPRWFYREVVLKLAENVLWMDNIAANEGIRIDRLKFKVWINGKEMKATYRCCPSSSSCGCSSITFPDNPLRYPMRCQTCRTRHGTTTEVLTAVSIEGEDVEVELPGPVGEHAFYGFLENFVRNAAKHNKDKLKKAQCLEVRMCLREENDEFYSLRIWDNVSDSCKVEDIRQQIRQELIDSEGKLRRQAWGIAEMKVTAALLAGCPDFTRMGEFLEVEQRPSCSCHKNSKGLVYRLRLMRPKRVIWLRRDHGGG